MYVDLNLYQRKQYSSKHSIVVYCVITIIFTTLVDNNKTKRFTPLKNFKFVFIRQYWSSIWLTTYSYSFVEVCNNTNNKLKL